VKYETFSQDRASTLAQCLHANIQYILILLCHYPAKSSADPLCDGGRHGVTHSVISQTVNSI
jgi:hypothetical protein